MRWDSIIPYPESPEMCVFVSCERDVNTHFFCNCKYLHWCATLPANVVLSDFGSYLTISSSCMSAQSITIRIARISGLDFRFRKASHRSYFSPLSAGLRCWLSGGNTQDWKEACLSRLQQGSIRASKRMQSLTIYVGAIPIKGYFAIKHRLWMFVAKILFI